MESLEKVKKYYLLLNDVISVMTYRVYNDMVNYMLSVVLYMNYMVFKVVFIISRKIQVIKIFYKTNCFSMHKYNVF